MRYTCLHPDKGYVWICACSLSARKILFFINGWSVKWVQTNRTTGHSHLYCYISRQCFLISMHVIIGRQYLPLSKRRIRVEHVETLPRSFHILNYMRWRNHRLKKMWVEYVSLLPSPFPPYPCCFFKCATSSPTILIINNFFFKLKIGTIGYFHSSFESE